MKVTMNVIIPLHADEIRKKIKLVWSHEDIPDKYNIYTVLVNLAFLRILTKLGAMHRHPPPSPPPCSPSVLWKGLW